MRAGLWLVLVVLSVLAPLTCGAVDSAVPAVSAPGEAPDRGLAPGRYCVAEVETDGGTIRDIALGGCVILQIDGGRLDLAAEGVPFVRTVFSVAELGRGASLLESREDDGTYRLRVAFLREGGLAILPSPGLVSVSLADPDGVELELMPGGAQRLRGNAPHEPFAIRSGAPDAVLRFLGNVAGLWFDRALRDDALRRAIFDESLYLVRVDAAAGGAPDQRVAATVETLGSAIMRAMALE